MNDEPTLSRNISPDARVLVYNFAYRGTVSDDNPIFGPGLNGSASDGRSADRLNNRRVKSDLQNSDAPEKATIDMLDIVDIETNKAKMKPDGQFQIVLAPTKNWIAEIVTGSWIVLMMSAEGEIPATALERADPKYVKMIGRVSSVRVSVSVDPAGARRSQYVVTGSDWGDIFNSNAYVSPTVLDTTDKNGKQSSLPVMSIKLAEYYELLNRTGKKITMALRPRTVARSLLNFFGKKTSLEQNTPAMRKPRITFSIPDKLGDFLQGPKRQNIVVKTVDERGNKTTVEEPADMATFLDVIGGVLGNTAYPNGKQAISNINDGIKTYTTPDNYKGEPQENLYDDTIPECRIELPPGALHGIYSMWQILSTAQVDALNEMYAELDLWNYSTYPTATGEQENIFTPFTLVIRPRPFVVRRRPFSLLNDRSMYDGNAIRDDKEKIMLAYAGAYASFFKSVRRCPIRLDSVVSFGASASWESKSNFIDLRIEKVDAELGWAPNREMILGIGQTYDVTSIERDGLRPTLRMIRALPPASETGAVPKPTNVVKIKQTRTRTKKGAATKKGLTAQQQLKTKTEKSKNQTTFKFIAPWADVKKAVKKIQKTIKIEGTIDQTKRLLLNDDKTILEEIYEGKKRISKKIYATNDPGYPALRDILEPNRAPAGDVTTDTIDAETVQAVEAIKIDPNNKAALFYRLYSWKYLLREWHFDTHRMLNGTITFIGHDWPFMVGCNLIVDAKVMGPALNTTYNMLTGKEVYLLAHIENVTHKFSVNTNGARTYVTSVQFVRGLFTDSTGDLISGLADPISDPFDKNYKYGLLDRNVMATSSDGGTINSNVTGLKDRGT